MRCNRAALAALAIAGLIVAGCGSDDTKSKSGTVRPEHAAPKSKSARARMIACIKGQLGFDVTPGDDPDNLSITGPQGKLKANVVIYPNAGAAARAVVQTQNKGVDAVSFGRAEFIRRAAGDSESGVILDCVSVQYARPPRG
jgi:hypothetical protein